MSFGRFVAWRSGRARRRADRDERDPALRASRRQATRRSGRAGGRSRRGERRSAGSASIGSPMLARAVARCRRRPDATRLRQTRRHAGRPCATPQDDVFTSEPANLGPVRGADRVLATASSSPTTNEITMPRHRRSRARRARRRHRRVVRLGSTANNAGATTAANNSAAPSQKLNATSSMTSGNERGGGSMR